MFKIPDDVAIATSRTHTPGGDTEAKITLAKDAEQIHVCSNLVAAFDQATAALGVVLSISVDGTIKWQTQSSTGRPPIFDFSGRSVGGVYDASGATDGKNLEMIISLGADSAGAIGTVTAITR